MPTATFHFPPGFLWGTATSSHQVEGGNHNNNWSAWENEPGRIQNGDQAGLACDWWSGRWKEDFDRAAETGQNAHRLSIEWSRVQPAPDRWDEDALDRYREMLRGLHQLGLTPVVTLHHFTDPLWLYQQGGWENERAPNYFAAYARKTVLALKEYANLWVTINEPNLYTYLGYMDGLFPPGKKDNGAAFRVGLQLLRGHAEAYHAIHQAQPTARVGLAHHFRHFAPAHPGFPPDVWITRFISDNLNGAFFNGALSGRFRFLGKSETVSGAANTQDYVGINYYTTERVTFRPLLPGAFFNTRAYPAGAEVSATGHIANVPWGLYEVIKRVNRAGLPILISENGVEDPDDTLRPVYTVEHIHQVWRAINNNWPVKGYFHWSLVDNFEWERGWSQRFGLWGLDLETRRRIRRPSVDLYADICKQNAIRYETVEKYAPAALPRLYPE